MLCGQSKERKGSAKLDLTLLNRLNLGVLKVDRVRSCSAHAGGQESFNSYSNHHHQFPMMPASSTLNHHHQNSALFFPKLLK